jgi:hypothetical protein
MENSTICCPGHYVLSLSGVSGLSLAECVYNAERFTFPAEKLTSDANAIVESWKELQSGTPNPSCLQAIISPMMQDIVEKNLFNKKIRLYDTRSDHAVFEANELSGWIFKLCVFEDDSEKILDRFLRNAQAQTRIRVKRIAYIVLPHSQVFPVYVKENRYIVQVEKKVDFDSDKQEELWCRDCMDPAVGELAELLCEVPCDDVNTRNFVVLRGTDQICVLDNELLNSEFAKQNLAVMGLFGDSVFTHSSGLVGCVNARQIEIIMKVARDHQLLTDASCEERCTAVCRRRIENMKDAALVALYYTQHKIHWGDELVQIHVDDSDFSDVPQDMAEKLKGWTLAIIDTINQEISAPINQTVKKHRSRIFNEQNTSFINNGTLMDCDDKLDSLKNDFLDLGLHLDPNEKNLEWWPKIQEKVQSWETEIKELSDQIAREGKDKDNKGFTISSIRLTMREHQSKEWFTSPDQLRKTLQRWYQWQDARQEQKEYQTKWLGYILRKLVSLGAICYYRENASRSNVSHSDEFASFFVQF